MGCGASSQPVADSPGTNAPSTEVRMHRASKAAALKKLELDPKDADAWYDLGYHNGGTVAGQGLR